MKKEDKELLIRELCARLPYGIKCHEDDVEYPFDIIGTTANNEEFVFSDGYERSLEQIKPYLRPMSSMTEKEQRYIWDRYGPSPLIADFEDAGDVSELFGYCRMNISKAPSFTDWLNSHYFDYRGLIEKGLALEAPKDMYIFE